MLPYQREWRHGTSNRNARINSLLGQRPQRQHSVTDAKQRRRALNRALCPTRPLLPTESIQLNPLGDAGEKGLRVFD